MAALGMLAAPAHATFTTETCPDGGCPGGLKFYDSTDSKDVTGFVGSVGAESGGIPDMVETFVDTNTAAGYATIKPFTPGTLDDLLFTPSKPLDFNDFSFRGQIERKGFSDALTIIVTGCLDVGGTCVKEAPQTINVTTDKGPEADFSRLGIISTDGETIFSVEVKTASGAFFKEFKQVQFSFAPGIPEPASWAMMLVGFGGVGAALRSRRRLPTAAL
jgi:hypothetical protein